MEEKDFKKETNQDNIKLDWEAPKVFCLDKNQTEGGPSTGLADDATYDPTPS